MSKKKRRSKKHSESRGTGPGNPQTGPRENQDIYGALQYLGNELQRSQHVINAVKREHCQLRDGFIFLMEKMNEIKPDMERELADYYATNHNLSGQIEFNYYNLDKQARRAA